MPESIDEISNLWMPETMPMSCIKKIFQNLAEANYAPYRGRLHCGSLSSPIMLFPTLEGYVQSNERKSYSSSCVVWIKQSNFQSDIQKVLRLAKKLLEKTPNFYKKLNRFRKAALVTGFYEMIDGMAAILERECPLLPGGSNPEAALQLTHASQALSANKDPSSCDSVITPKKKRFTSN